MLSAPSPEKTLYNVRFLAILNPRSFSEHVATLPEMQFRIHLRRRRSADLPRVRPRVVRQRRS
ncbi:hypothetical protein EMIT0P100_170088 [Pseudomonas sp. IT-P100]